MSERVTVQVDAIGNFNSLIGEVGKFKSQLQSLKLPDKITNKLEKSFENVESRVSKFQAVLDKGINTKGDFSKLLSSANEAERAINHLKEDVRSIGDKDIQFAVLNSADIKQAEDGLNKILNLEKQLKSFGTSKGQDFISESSVAKMQKIANTSEGLKKRFQAVDDAFKTGNIDKASAAIEKLITHAQKYQAIAEKNGKSTQKWDDTIKWATGTKEQISGLVTEANKARTAFDQMKSSKFDQMKGSINGIASGLDTATGSMKNFIHAQADAASRTNQLNEQVGHLRTQANYFFGLQNMGRLIARGIREAAESVRDLDKAMTETAVVTDFSVSDMWNMLPEYTKLANELGATTQGAYETMTLYFQQGLNKQETFEIGEETMKMARIAGLDYAQTTNMMTAALRGFNMELNQTSAKRVNDVYSKLAAITASDTRELGLAMERTASIAHSANMDFGNTTAFLAQMIETTREAPENLGTAMKTIIARFQELKKSPYEISEVEGEEVDFNRVDKALKSIGVDLMDSRDKFRDLDDVFMDISQRWDGLSQTTQRYIATMAAGSRQQSRFLAMVQNYERLKELTTAAATSEGASDVQFSKTLESYEAKVNKLKNAWQAFTMSLANNKAVKAGVDALQKIITFGNKIIEVFGKAGSAFGDFGKGLGEMIAAFGLGALGFKGLKAGANLGLGLLGRMTVKDANPMSGMFTSGSAIGKNFAKITKEERSAILQKRNNINKLMQEGISSQGKTRASNVKDIRAQLTGLTADQQKAILSSSPILRASLQESYSKAYKGLDLSKDSQKALKTHWKNVQQQIQAGEKTVNQGLKELYNPYTTAKQIGGPVGKELIKAIDNEIAKSKTSPALKDRLTKAANEKIAKGRLKSIDKNAWIQDKMRAETAKSMAGFGGTSPVAIGKASAAMARFSSTTVTAGQAVMGLGMAMSAAGFPAFGAVVSTVGTGLMGIGMAAEGAAAAIKKLGVAYQFLKGFKGAIPGLLVASAAAAAVAVTIKMHQKAIKETRKAGNRVVSIYTKTTEKIKKELDSLNDYQQSWATWAAGVDENGNNINLGTGEYEDYLKAIKKITTAHPELIKGYNAVGNAIVDNNTVLREATKLAKEEEKQAKKKYLNSGQKIINKQKTTKRWKKSQAETLDVTTLSLGGGSYNYKTDHRSDLVKEAQTAADAIKQIKGGDKLLKEYGITFDKLGRITDQGVESLRTRAGDLNNALAEMFTNPTKEQEKSLTDINDKIATFGDTISGLEEVTKDTYDWAWTYASEQGYNQIDSNLIVPFQTAIQRIAEKGLSQRETEKEIDALGKKYKNLGGNLQDFNKIQQGVEKAQKDFGKNLDAEAYKSTVEELTKPMDAWIKKLENSTDQADLILAEWLKNQKAKFLDLSESLPTLEEGLNTLAGRISSAQSAYDNWTKQTEGGDYYTAVEGYKKMFDEVNDGIDDLGNKSQSWWQAARSMFGDDYVMSHSAEQVQAHMKKIGNYLDEGETGVNNFLRDIRDNFQDTKLDDTMFKGIAETVGDLITANESGGLDFNLDGLSGEQFDSLAQTLGYSSDLFTALLNKARQFHDIDFSNTEDMRKALLASDSTLLGQGKTNGNQNIYTKESDFINEAYAAGVTDPKKIKQAQANLEEAGTIFLKNANEISKSDFSKYIKDWGIADGTTKGKGKGKELNTTTAHDFIAELNKVGYNKDEILSAYETAIEGNRSLISDKETADFNEIYDSIKAAEDPVIDSVSSIQGTTEGILSAINAQNLSLGILSEQTKQEIADKTSQADNFKNVSQWDKYKDYKSDREEYISDMKTLKDTLETARDKNTKGSEQYEKLDEQVKAVDAALKKVEKSELSRQEFLDKQAQVKQKELLQGAASGNQDQLKLLIEQNIKGDLTGFGELGLAAQDAAKLGDNLSKSGEQGKEAAFEVKQAFIDANAEGLSKLSPNSVNAIIDKLKLTDNQLKQIQAEHPEIKFEADTAELDKADEKAQKPTKEEKVVKYKADTTNLNKPPTLKGGSVDAKQQFQQFKEKGVPNKTDQDLSIKYTPKIENEGDVKTTLQQKIKKILDSISKSSSIVSVKGKVETKGGGKTTTTTKNTVTNKTTNVTAKASGQSAITTLGSTIKNLKNKAVNVKAAVSGANKVSTLKSEINSLKNKTVTITTNKVTHTETRAKGQNNYIPYRSTPSFGSAARGRRGTVGPKNRGGLTLTGETGFEIAWIPSENRSMILGADGPQMLSLPSDAVIWNHQQSKDILKKRQTIPAGSANETVSGSTGDLGGSGGSSSKKKKKKKSKKKSKKKKNKNKNKGTINNFSIEEVVRFNIDPKLTTLTNAIEKRTKDIEKSLTKIGNTYDNIVKSAKDQITALKGVQDYNQKLYNSYNRQLAELRKQKGSVSWTDNKGKSHDKTINISSYLNADGSVNQAAIAKLKTRAEREATFNFVSGLAKPLTEGMESAKKAIQDAQNQIDELGQKISEAFYQWENELTEVYDLTQRINDEVSLTDRFTSQVELELAKLNVGFGNTAESIGNIRKVLIRSNDVIQDQIKNQQQMIAARQRELMAAYSVQDELDTINKYKNDTSMDSATKAATVQWAQEQYKAAQLGQKYVKNLFKDIDGHIEYEIDWEQFNADNDQSPYNKTTYDAIKKYLDDLNNAATEFNKSIQDQTDFIKQTYDALKEYQDKIADIEDTLINGVEEEIQNETENQKKLSDAISDSLKDLLDEVKRKLDERRQQEDNAKTERDIAQKQQRLAALRADTSGGNQVEIAQLEKEIADAQQDYQRSLEDQLLDRLQQQADEAAQQRERQIELAETLNDLSSSTNKELVDMWLKDPERYKEEIKNAWLEANDYSEKGEAGQYTLEQEFESTFAELVTAVKQSGFDSINGIFTATADNTATLVNLLTQLNNDSIGREDELAHALNAQTDATDRNTESLLTVMEENYTAAQLKQKGVDAGTLKKLGYTAKDLIGDNPEEPTYTAEELRTAGFSASDLIEGGITNPEQLRTGGYTAQEVKDAGIADFAKLITAYTLAELKNANFNQNDFGTNGISYADARTLYSAKDLLDVEQYSIDAAAEIKKAEDAAAKKKNTIAHPYGYISSYSGSIKKGASGDKVKAVQYALNKLIGAGLKVDGKFGDKTAAAVKKFQKKYKLTQDGSVGPNTKKKFKALGYSTGGIADYTGPAWLHGTPSKPELVLNAADTKNFLALKDVLSKAMGSTNSIENSYGGDMNFEVNINVDHLNNDYDVDKVADRVRKIIVKDAGYRNVTQVRNFR